MLSGTLQAKQEAELSQLFQLTREIERSLRSFVKIHPQNCRIGKVYPITKVYNRRK